MSVNVCLDDIFCITEHFVTKFGIAILNHRTFCHNFGMVMQHHEPESWGNVFVVVAIFKAKVTARLVSYLVL